jgi:hypothetical protein
MLGPQLVFHHHAYSDLDRDLGQHAHANGIPDQLGDSQRYYDCNAGTHLQRRCFTYGLGYRERNVDGD